MIFLSFSVLYVYKVVRVTYEFGGFGNSGEGMAIVLEKRTGKYNICILQRKSNETEGKN